VGACVRAYACMHACLRVRVPACVLQTARGVSDAAHKVQQSTKSAMQKAKHQGLRVRVRDCVCVCLLVRSHCLFKLLYGINYIGWIETAPASSERMPCDPNTKHPCILDVNSSLEKSCTPVSKEKGVGHRSSQKGSFSQSAFTYGGLSNRLRARSTRVSLLRPKVLFVSFSKHETGSLLFTALRPCSAQGLAPWRRRDTIACLHKLAVMSCTPLVAQYAIQDAASEKKWPGILGKMDL
jgi:hypothetical protein